MSKQKPRFLCGESRRLPEKVQDGLFQGRLANKWLGNEKCVDVKLATDMIVLKDIYDIAVIVSGDQDYVPAAEVVKDAGKTVVNVSFSKRNGGLLPGGARRLGIATDASVIVGFDDLVQFMSVEVNDSE